MSTSTPDTITFDWPTLPDGGPVTAHDVQDIWNRYVKPDQDAELPQSGEMRVLMGILRAYWKGYLDCEGEEQLSVFPPVVAPLGWLVDDERLVREVWDTFIAPNVMDPHRDRTELALASLLQDLGSALRARA